MPRGTKDIDRRDRPVIVVASDRGVKKLTMTALNRGVLLLQLYKAAQGAMAADDADYLLGALENLLDLGHPVYLYEPYEAVRLFQFDIGQTPRDGAVYVQHPIFPDCYISPDQYAQRLAREKEAAFRQLASALGAKELRLVSAELKERRGWFGGKAKLREAATQVGIKASFSDSGAIKKTVYSEFGQPMELPRVPVDLRRWVAMDPDLRTMANQPASARLQ